jgi:heterodisulfide reductase subunit A2
MVKKKLKKSVKKIVKKKTVKKVAKKVAKKAAKKITKKIVKKSTKPIKKLTKKLVKKTVIKTKPVKKVVKKTIKKSKPIKKAIIKTSLKKKTKKSGKKSVSAKLKVKADLNTFIKRPTDKIQVGVFLCHCGKNIGGVVDVPNVTEYAKTLPDVVFADDNLYSCADPGQDAIKKAIKDHGINRVVVAACSPKMHEPTFRRCITEVGLNPYFLEMANIREHCSWVHIWEKEKATEKSKDIVAMAVAKARHLQPLENIGVSVEKKVLIIGGGIAGCQAALDLGDMGFGVYLVEREPSIGGRMAQLDKTFPTMDCSICIEGPKLVDVGRHPNIKLLTFTEVQEVTGFIGSFHVVAKTKPRYVDMDKCTGCGECTLVCPVVKPSKFEVNLKPTKAIAAHFPQAVPQRYSIDPDACIKCYKCADVCGARNAIDFTQREVEHKFKVGTIIVATGCESFNPINKSEYGFGRYENVIDAIEFERIVCAGGPTGGHLIRRDKKEAKRYAFLQCVGSRDKTCGNEYCSNVCCLNSIKLSLLIKEHVPDADVSIYYMDIRAFGKGFEELYARARNAGVQFVKSRISSIVEGVDKNLILTGEDVINGGVFKQEVDLAILATGMIPDRSSKKLSEILHIPRNNDGFYLESHPKLKPLDSPGDGIYLAGSGESPKDIKDSVISASGAAARAAIPMNKGKVFIEGITVLVEQEKCIGCGKCVKACPYGANSLVDKKCVHNEVKCHGCGTCVAECPTSALDQKHFTDQQIMAQIDAALADNPKDKIMAFCCNWCSYGGADLAGVSRFQYPPEIRIIRVMCSGRISEKFVMRAFEKGAPIVWVTGCHLPSDCHYISGNHFAKSRIEALQKKLPDKIGLPSDRLKLNWISAAEGIVFANYVDKLVKELKEINGK